jgi:hypothetical protein
VSVEAAFLVVDAVSDDDEVELDEPDFDESDVDFAAAPLAALESALFSEPLLELLLEELDSPSDVIDDEEAPRLSVL